MSAKTTQKTDAAEQKTGDQDSQATEHVEQKPEHDPAHGRWILDPVTGEKRNNNEG